MTPDKKITILQYLTDSLNQLIATKEHLTHQLSLPEEHRVTEYSTIELENAVPIYNNQVHQLQESLKEFEHDTQVAKSEGNNG